MSLRHFHHHDGRAVSFDRHTVIQLEEHSSGEGAFVRLAPVERSVELHLREDYATVLAEINEGEFERALKRTTEAAAHL